MSKRQVIMVLGVWIMALPFLGFPDSWDRILFLITGLVIVLVAYSTSRSKPAPSEASRKNSSMPFVEHRKDNGKDAITSGNSSEY